MGAIDIPSLFAASTQLRCVDVANALGISRQAALKHLRRAVLAGTLQIDGVGCATRYVLTQPRETMRRSLPFWEELARESSCLRYIPIGDGAGAHCRTASQAHRLLSGHTPAFALLDFHGVLSLSESFARALVTWWRTRAAHVLPINASPVVLAAIDRAMRSFDLTPVSGWSE